MHLKYTRRLIPSRSTPTLLTFVSLSTVFVLVNVRNSTQITFVWEEWHHLYAISRSFIEGLTWGGTGYFAPLGNAIFMFETQVFGLWYPGYVLVNSFLVVLSVSAVYSVCPRSGKTSFLPLVAVFLFSAGTVFTVGFGNEVSDLLSIAFGAVALRSWVRKGSTYTVVALLLLGILANNLVGQLVVLIFFGTACAFEASNPRDSSARAGIFRLTFIAAVVLMFGVTTGYLSRYVSAMAIGDSSFYAPDQPTSLYNISYVALSLVSFWILTAGIPGFVSYQKFYLDYLMELLNRPYALAALILLLALPWVGLLNKARKTNVWPWTRLGWLFPLCVGFGAIAFALQLAAFRAEQAFDIRFSIYWLPPTLAVIGVLLLALANRFGGNWRYILSALLWIPAIAALLVAVIDPTQSLDLVRPRTVLSHQVEMALTRCPVGSLPDAVSKIASGLTWSQVCQAYSVVTR